MLQEQEESISSTSFKPENFSSPYRQSTFGNIQRQKQTIIYNIHNINSLNLKGHRDIRLIVLLSIFVLLYKMVIVSKYKLPTKH